MTAVEWLFAQMGNIAAGYETELDQGQMLEKAKEMEKEQSIDFARLCLNKAKDLDNLTAFINVKQYYDENFKL